MESDDENIPANIFEAANTATLELLPKKSKERYMKIYVEFTNWCKKNNAKCIKEEVMLAYFAEMGNTVKSSTLWSRHSMLKLTLMVHENIDISKFAKVIAFLKRKAVGYKAKKYRIFNRNEIDNFLLQAPDNDFLLMKTVLIIAVAGGCRVDELVKMSIDDVEDKDTILVVHLPNSKTYAERTFVVVGGDNNINLNLYRKYVALRPCNTPHRRLFVYYKNGKCTTQPVGHHTLGAVPFRVAMFLELLNPKDYTGHAFCRSSATLLVDGGAGMTELKRHGAWKSNSVAESFLENSLQNKINTAVTIQNCGRNKEESVSGLNSSTENLPINFNNVTNTSDSSISVPCYINFSSCQCNINVHINKQLN